jgi:cbb3-type cytochrome oxidase maturation protein
MSWWRDFYDLRIPAGVSGVTLVARKAPAPGALSVPTKSCPRTSGTQRRPAALGLGLLGLAAFVWSLRIGQYQDMDGAAFRILGDDDMGS